jgi:hypothetical protein
MNWNNTQGDGLPGNEEEVLIAVEGVYYIALFDKIRKTFFVNEEQKQKSFKVGDHQIYWTEFHNFYSEERIEVSKSDPKKYKR